MKIIELTKEQLVALRNQIKLNSCFLNDYNNDLGVDPQECCTFFDGYVEDLYDKAEVYQFATDDFFEIVKKFDTENNLYDYWLTFADSIMQALNAELSSLLKTAYEDFKNSQHKGAYTYSIGGNLRAGVSDQLSLDNNQLIVGGVYDFKKVSDLHKKMIDTIKSYLPNATQFRHNRAPYPRDDLWDEFTVNGKLIISVQFNSGTAYSTIAFE